MWFFMKPKEQPMNDLFGSPTVVEKTLRPHQDEAMRMLRESFVGGNTRTVMSAPTGFGKTLVAATIIKGAMAKGKRVIFTAPAISLINQTVSAFEAEGIEGIGVM
jgi:superfamily II DNA or RNA helicase